MPSDSFQIWNEEEITTIDANGDLLALDGTPITGNGRWDLAVSTPTNNQQDWNAIKAIIQFHSILPSDSFQRDFEIFARVEGSNNEAGPNKKWATVAHMFTSMRRDNQGLVRVLEAHPFMPNHENVDDIVYEAGTQERHSKTTSKMVYAEYRVRLILNEFGYSTGKKCKGICVTCFGELYNV